MPCKTEIYWDIQDEQDVKAKNKKIFAFILNILFIPVKCFCLSLITVLKAQV